MEKGNEHTKKSAPNFEMLLSSNVFYIKGIDKVIFEF